MSIQSANEYWLKKIAIKITNALLILINPNSYLYDRPVQVCFDNTDSTK